MATIFRRLQAMIRRETASWTSIWLEIVFLLCFSVMTLLLSNDIVRTLLYDEAFLHSYASTSFHLFSSKQKLWKHGSIKTRFTLPDYRENYNQTKYSGLVSFKWNIGFSGNKYMTSYFSFTGLTTDGTHGPAKLIQTYGANNMGLNLWEFTGAPILEQQTTKGPQHGSILGNHGNVLSRNT